MFGKDSEVLCVILSSLKLCSTILKHLGLPDLWCLFVFSAQWDCCTLLGILLPAARSRMQSQAEDPERVCLTYFLFQYKILYCLLFNFSPVFLLFMMKEYVWTLSLYHGLKLKFSYCIFICTLDKNVNLKTGGRDIHVTTTQNNI